MESKEQASITLKMPSKSLHRVAGPLYRSAVYGKRYVSTEKSMHKEQVRKFYEVLWDAHDKDAIPSILHDNFTFRGSLGQEKQGYNSFTEYVDMVHKALTNYKCIIEELVEEGEKVFAKMSFTSIHQDEFMGYAPTHQQVTWKGCALFTFQGERIADVWVLGDMKDLEDQLKRNETYQAKFSRRAKGARG